VSHAAAPPDRGLARNVLGIDPGLNTSGYAVLSYISPQQIRLLEAGVVRTARRGSLAERLAELHQGITEVIAAHRPQVMALEQLFTHYQRPRTAILMGHARGVICLAAAQAGIAVVDFPPAKVKRLLTGNGRADKAQIQQAVRLQLKLAQVPEPHDVADAMAVALCQCANHRTL
jgi:crossover junction endodeoxyribonuclease RuvC